MNLNRRNLLRECLKLGCVAAMGRSLLARGRSILAQGSDLRVQAPAHSDSDLIERMKWMNEPADWSRSGEVLMVHSRGKTDFWRKTFYGYITDNGHFFHLPANGDFTFEARINGKYAALYDQAGLMVRLDAENWMKCGTEFFDGRRHASVVFTRDFSDWSTMPDLSDTASVCWRAVRKKDSIETLCSLDGKIFTSVRQGYFPPSVKVEVGIMCAAPEGPGFEATFDKFRLQMG